MPKDYDEGTVCVMVSTVGAPSLRRGRKGSRRSMLLVAFLAFLGIVTGPGTAYAGDWNTLPDMTKYVTGGIAAASAWANGVGVSGVGVTAAEATGEFLAGAAATATVGAVALGGAGAIYVAWHAGDALGHALPCLDCPSDSGTGYAFPGGWHATQIGGNDAQGRQVWRITIGTGVTGLANGDTPYNVGILAGYPYPTNYSESTTSSSVPAVGATMDIQTGVVYAQVPTSACLVVHRTSGSAVQVMGHLYGVPLPVGCVTGTPEPIPPSTAPTGTPVQVVTTATCTPTAGGTATSVSATSATFHAADAAFPAMAVGACPAGSARTALHAVVHPLDGSLPDTNLGTITMPTTAPTGHPEWAPCLPGGAQWPCVLYLTHTAPDGTTRTYDPSTDYPIYDPTADPTGTTTVPRSWSCVWGTLAVAVTECSPVYLDKPRVVMPPVTNPSNCDGSGYTFNPISWVVVPLKCLFIPDAAHVTEVTSLTSDAAGRAPLGYVTGALSWAAGLVPSGSACWHLDVTIPHVASFTAIDTCTPGPVEAVVMGWRWLLNIGMFAGLFLPLCWWAWKAYAPGTTGSG